MKRSKIVELLDARIICGGDQPDREISSACGADMMSDVLAFTKHNAILLTGLVNNHVLRTAEMLDIQDIMFVRGKNPTEDLVEMAEDMDMVLMSTSLPMFEACGVLYSNGVKGGTRGNL